MGGVGGRQRGLRLAPIGVLAATFAFGTVHAEVCPGGEISPIPEMIDVYASAVAVASIGKIDGSKLQHVCAEAEEHLRYRIRISKSVYWVRTSQFLKETNPRPWQPSPPPTAPAAGTFGMAPSLPGGVVVTYASGAAGSAAAAMPNAPTGAQMYAPAALGVGTVAAMPGAPMSTSTPILTTQGSSSEALRNYVAYQKAIEKYEEQMTASVSSPTSMLNTAALGREGVRNYAEEIEKIKAYEEIMAYRKMTASASSKPLRVTSSEAQSSSDDLAEQLNRQELVSILGALGRIAPAAGPPASQSKTQP